jgi:uncharacterized Zn-binding protein involved in type VI secretion
MGKPAARLGDSTAHGGAIVAGAPTVLIGGAPAARMNDMHVCPMFNPGTPPPPHVGQQIMMGSPTVFICGQMAARMGDMLMCSGPPDIIVGGCLTVLIGEGGASGAAASAALAGGGSDQIEGGHFLDVEFIDKAGNPIRGINYFLKSPKGDTSQNLLRGPITKYDIDPGSYEISLKAITSARWSKKSARDGENVKMMVEMIGFDPGTKADFRVWEKDYNKADKLVAEIKDISIKTDRADADWKYVWVDDDMAKTPSGYSAPEYYFTVEIESCFIRSGILSYRDYIELTLKDFNDKPIPTENYKVFLSSGEIRQGKLDGNGYAKIDKVPPGAWRVSFPDRSDIGDDIK